MKNSPFLICFLALTSLFAPKNSFASDDNVKFGKIAPIEFEIKTCPIDSNAHAYYLFDKGNSLFEYVAGGFQIKYFRHFRIKIIDKAGFDLATISIPYYRNSNSEGRVSNLKACTYNMENGKLVKSPLEKSAIFDEVTTKYWNQKKFALPNVKEGSIIEVSYSISSNVLWNLPGWDYQKYIPVMQSNYEVRIPEYFNYNQFHRGYIFPKTNTSNESTTITLDGGLIKNISERMYTYDIKEIPAFPVGEELTTPQNYIGRIEFELGSFQVPGSVYKDFTTNWSDVNNLFLESDDFGLRLKLNGHMKEDAQAIMSSSTTELEKMQKALQLIKSKMKWDNTNSCWCSASLKKTFDTGVGNAADINLNLVALLTEMGMKSSPVVLSTRDNGMIHPSSPSINQMNYAIAQCKIDTTIYLMDATDKYSEIDVLPSRCLNDKGWAVDNDLTGWVPLLKTKKSIEKVMYILDFLPEGKFTGEIAMSNKEYKALSKRNKIKEYESEEKYIEKIQENNSGLTINEYSFKNLDTLGVDLTTNYKVEISNRVESAGDLFYFSPLFFDAYEKNPFSLEKREYPIEYPYPIVESVIVQINLPEGYKVESLPQSVNVTSLEEGCKFSYKTSVEGNKIMVLSNLQINKTIIPGMKYNEIKGFFEEVVKKQNEKVVLKKI